MIGRQSTVSCIEKSDKRVQSDQSYRTRSSQIIRLIYHWNNNVYTLGWGDVHGFKFNSRSVNSYFVFQFELVVTCNWCDPHTEMDGSWSLLTGVCVVLLTIHISLSWLTLYSVEGTGSVRPHHCMLMLAWLEGNTPIVSLVRLCHSVQSIKLGTWEHTSQVGAHITTWRAHYTIWEHIISFESTSKVLGAQYKV